MTRSDRVPDDLWMEVCDIVQETGIKTTSMERNAKKQNSCPSVLTIIGALVVMGSIQWQLALIVGLMIPIFLIVVMSMRRSMAQASRETKQKTGHINQEIESSLSGIRTAKAFANEQVEHDRFHAANGLFM